MSPVQGRLLQKPFFCARQYRGRAQHTRFFLAYLNLNDYYYTAPEVEVAHGYCDFFLLPNLTHYQANHSYILELKYMPKKDYTEEAAEKQWQEAVEQINGYAVAPRVETLRQGTQMHKIVMQFVGWELLRMEEI